MKLVPGAVTLGELEAVWRGAVPALDASARPAVAAAAGRVAAAVAAGAPVYGVNTGFGKLASVAIPAGDTARLQRNLILSHCSGVGAATPAAVVRLMMALKIVSLGRGASGVRWAIVALIEGMLARRRGAGGARAGVGGGVGRPGAARAHGGGDARGGRGRGRRRADARRRGAGGGGAGAGRAGGEGGARADQRHAVLHGLGAGGAVRGVAGGAERAPGLVPVDRCDHGVDGAVAGGDPCAAGASRAGRGGRGDAGGDGGLGDPGEPPRGGCAGAGPLLHPLPAAGHRGGDGPAPAGGGDAPCRGECRDGQSAGARRCDRLGRKLSCGAGGLRRRHHRAGGGRDRGDRAAAGGADGRSDAFA